MPRVNVVVPVGMVPGPEGYEHAFAGPSPCDAGANSRELWPAAWVNVTIRPVGVVTPDRAGRLLHCLWSFARPTVGAGKRRQAYPGWAPREQDLKVPLRVESDPLCGWIGTDVTLSFVGGTVGDEYDVTVTYNTPRDEVDIDRAIDIYEDPFRFKLTSMFVGEDFQDFPEAPDFHTDFQIVRGAAEVVNELGTVSLGSVPFPPDTLPPLNLGQFRVSGGIFQTVGAF